MSHNHRVLELLVHIVLHINTKMLLMSTWAFPFSSHRYPLRNERKDWAPKNFAGAGAGGEVQATHQTRFLRLRLFFASVIAFVISLALSWART